MKTDYCVAIRTLGRAGEKYQTLLNSLKSQTIKPLKILVYLPYGYEIPNETIGIEQIIRCDKGMVTQRSLPFTEVDTDYVLLCDDDLYLPNNAVESLFKAMSENDGDCICPDVFINHKKSITYKIMSFIHGYVLPHFDHKWAIKIRYCGVFSYNNNPKKNILRTQSGSGPCALCKISVLNAIHFNDERWIEQFPYVIGEDQLFFYKMYIMGYKLLMHYDSGVKHLDARSTKRQSDRDKFYIYKKISFIIWYRTCFKISDAKKTACFLSFSFMYLILFFSCMIEIIYYRQPKYLIDYFRALIDGIKYVCSDEYKLIPKFDAYI